MSVAHLVLDCIIISSQINLGVIQENPSTTAGTIRILDHIQKYVPSRTDGSLFPVAVNGEELTVEGSRAGQKHRLTNQILLEDWKVWCRNQLISSRCVEVQVTT